MCTHSDPCMSGEVRLGQKLLHSICKSKARLYTLYYNLTPPNFITQQIKMVSKPAV
jgi:hypothetical protein